MNNTLPIDLRIQFQYPPKSDALIDSGCFPLHEDRQKKNMWLKIFKAGELQAAKFCVLYQFLSNDREYFRKLGVEFLEKACKEIKPDWDELHKKFCVLSQGETKASVVSPKTSYSYRRQSLDYTWP